MRSTPPNYYEERERKGIDLSGESRVKQAFAEESDVNAIMKKYLATGIVTHQNLSTPRYGDFSTVDDYLSAVNRVRDAQERFMTLPAEIRDYVDNDPAKLLELVFDPDRVEEARSLGLLGQDEPAPAVRSEPESPSPAEPSEPPAPENPGA